MNVNTTLLTCLVSPQWRHVLALLSVSWADVYDSPAVREACWRHHSVGSLNRTFSLDFRRTQSTYDIAGYLSDPPENCHLNVKKLPKTWVYSKWYYQILWIYSKIVNHLKYIKKRSNIWGDVEKKDKPAVTSKTSKGKTRFELIVWRDCGAASCG